MIGLDRLLEKQGVVAAGQFSEDGLAIRAVGDIDEDQMNKVARICSDFEANAKEKAANLKNQSGQPWGDLSGWTLMAGNMALLVAGNTGVFVETEKADFNDLFMGLFFDLGDPTQQVAN